MELRETIFLTFSCKQQQFRMRLIEIKVAGADRVLNIFFCIVVPIILLFISLGQTSKLLVRDFQLIISYPKLLEPLHFADRVVCHLLDLPRVADKPNPVDSNRGLGDVCAHNGLPVYYKT